MQNEDGTPIDFDAELNDFKPGGPPKIPGEE